MASLLEKREVGWHIRTSGIVYKNRKGFLMDSTWKSFQEGTVPLSGANRIMYCDWGFPSSSVLMEHGSRERYKPDKHYGW